MQIATTDMRPLPQGRAPARPLFAIGDTHGYADAMEAILRHVRGVIEREHAGREVDLVYLGDYIDRGPDPRGVLSLVARGLAMASVKETALMGNHDLYLVMAARLRGEAMTIQEWMTWFANGGDDTLTGLGLSFRSATPENVRAALGAENVALLERLELSYRSGDILCVHAGVDPRRPLEDQTQEDMLWIRGPFLRPAELAGAWPPGVTVVHGHTPNAYGVFEHRIGVDTGGYATGMFTAVEITEAGVRFHHLDRGSVA